jgi:hypothetical protein
MGQRYYLSEYLAIAKGSASHFALPLLRKRLDAHANAKMSSV